MSNVAVTNTTNSNVTHAKSQANDSTLNHFIRGNHHLFEKTSSRVAAAAAATDSNNQNSNPELLLIKKQTALCELEPNVAAYGIITNNRQSPPEDTSCMRSLNSSVIVGASGNDLTGNCHCLSQQQQPLQQQCCNKFPDNQNQSGNNQTADLAAHKIITNVAQTVTSNCTTVIRTNHNNNSNNFVSKGLKRANETDEPKARIPVVVSSSHPVTLSGGNRNVSEAAAGSPQRLLGDNNNSQVETGIGDNDYTEEENDDDEDGEEESNFEYEPVLIKILNEKKLALSNSPDVIRFLSAFRNHHHQQQSNCP